MKNSLLIIPALEPELELINYVKEIIARGMKQVIIIDDGSGFSYDEVFQQLSKIPRVQVLSHHKNRGKGAALKTAMHAYQNQGMRFSGIITADADGQHAIDDIFTIADRLEENRYDYILGMRQFERKNTPFRNFLGNTLSSYAFKLLYGIYLKDTQTGLRGIAHHEIEEALRIKGEAFEYEMNMLIYMSKEHKNILMLDIKTIYGEEYSSHFSAIIDSLKIVGVGLKGVLKTPIAPKVLVAEVKDEK